MSAVSTAAPAAGHDSGVRGGIRSRFAQIAAVFTLQAGMLFLGAQR